PQLPPSQGRAGGVACVTDDATTTLRIMPMPHVARACRQMTIRNPIGCGVRRDLAGGSRTGVDRTDLVSRSEPATERSRSARSGLGIPSSLGTKPRAGAHAGIRRPMLQSAAAYGTTRQAEAEPVSNAQTSSRGARRLRRHLFELFENAVNILLVEGRT